MYTPSVNGDTCAHPARPLELNKCHTARRCPRTRSSTAAAAASGFGCNSAMELLLTFFTSDLEEFVGSTDFWMTSRVSPSTTGIRHRSGLGLEEGGRVVLDPRVLILQELPLACRRTSRPPRLASHRPDLARAEHMLLRTTLSVCTQVWK
eukprot:SAG22_NODE_2273_length_2766_cov_2.731159_1_plen_150_part_00